MSEQAGHGNGQGATPRRDPRLPEGVPSAHARDSRLAAFAAGGEWDTCPPSASLALALEAASGPEWRCPGASRDELFGLLRQWQALESRAVAGKLGILRALIREDDQPLPRPGWHQWVTPSGRAYIQGPKRYPAQPLLFGEVLSAAGAPVGHPDEGFQVGEDERAVPVTQGAYRIRPGKRAD